MHIRAPTVTCTLHFLGTGHYTPLAIGGHKYFITFINDHSRYGFVELIREKSETLEAFKYFKAKVKLQQGKKIKMVHYDRCCEYCGRYDEGGRNL